MPVIILRVDTYDAIWKPGNDALAKVSVLIGKSRMDVEVSDATHKTLLAVSDDMDVAARHVIWKGAEAYPKKTGTRPAKPKADLKAKEHQKPLAATQGRKTAPKAHSERKSAKDTPSGPRAFTTGAGGPGDTILQLCLRKEGATLKEAMAATGWLAHSARAYITDRIRKRGYTITRQKVDGVSRYFAKATAIEEAI